MRDIELSEREAEVYRAIVDFFLKYKIVPTFRELTGLTTVRSTSTVQSTVRALVEKGLLGVYPGSTFRSIQVLDAVISVPGFGEEVK